MFNSTQETLFAEKLMDLANLTIAGLVVGQFIGNQPINWSALIIGVIAYIMILCTALMFIRNRR